ncbi:unnamed protein product [Peronospora belbahrii]|uniref:Glycosyl transferase family 1 domain-containing protein n=1 Tax=Peronospora belbahrii TaxID=622444 RepID=A0AAU9LFR3_9STRA|nr:unnamed protein product [Peronospora belbahrii]
MFEISFVTEDVPSITISDAQRILKAVAALEYADTATPVDANDLYPEELFQIDWRQEIEENDILHHAALHRGCWKHKNSVISSEFGRMKQNETQDLLLLINESDPQLLEKLSRCTAVDIFLPSGLRGFGYCEDAAAYIKFLKARILPEWVMDRKFQDKSKNRTITYHDLCPKTPMIFFNHYWGKVPDALDWPAAKPLYLMPNVEMYELASEHIWRADVILCKTLLCTRYLRLWFKQEGNPRGALVLYTRHTTSNVALTFKSQLAVSEVKARAEKNYWNVSFLHIVGKSKHKGTRQVLDCWLSRTDLPPLELYVSDGVFGRWLAPTYSERIAKSTNIKLHLGQVEPAAFGQLIADATYFMCSSDMEGYGHYINQARSSRGFIFTTDVAPMNELITPSSGALIRAKAVRNPKQFLGGASKKAHALRGVSGFVAKFNGGAVCDAVLNTLNNTSPKERAIRADRALQQYYFDTVFFAQKMQELRELHVRKAMSKY